MCRPIRELTQMKGYDVENHVLACFGGAGAQHACAIANMLGMKTVFIHKHSGILSAVGLHLAGVWALGSYAMIWSDEVLIRHDMRHGLCGDSFVGPTGRMRWLVRGRLPF